MHQKLVPDSYLAYSFTSFCKISDLKIATMLYNTIAQLPYFLGLAVMEYLSEVCLLIVRLQVLDTVISCFSWLDVSMLVLL